MSRVVDRSCWTCWRVQKAIFEPSFFCFRIHHFPRHISTYKSSTRLSRLCTCSRLAHELFPLKLGFFNTIFQLSSTLLQSHPNFSWRPHPIPPSEQLCTGKTLLQSIRKFPLISSIFASSFSSCSLPLVLGGCLQT